VKWFIKCRRGIEIFDGRPPSKLADVRAMEHVEPAAHAANTPPRPRRQERRSTMGDKSPKATQKKNSQKQAKTASSDNKKNQDIAAKQATKQKAEAARKK
jgi:hypothetical protein